MSYNVPQGYAAGGQIANDVGKCKPLFTFEREKKNDPGNEKVYGALFVFCLFLYKPYN